MTDHLRFSENVSDEGIGVTIEVASDERENVLDTDGLKALVAVQISGAIEGLESLDELRELGALNAEGNAGQLAFRESDIFGSPDSLTAVRAGVEAALSESPFRDNKAEEALLEERPFRSESLKEAADILMEVITLRTARKMAMVASVGDVSKTASRLKEVLQPGWTPN